MAHDRLLLSIVSPAYEEEQALAPFHAALSEALARLPESFNVEIIYVDDGSNDGTFAVIRNIALSDDRVRGISLSRNFGHQAALTAGLAHARGDAVVMLDSDLQHPPMLIPDLVARWQSGFDVVQAIRDVDPKLNWFKRASSAWFYKLLRRLSDLDVRLGAADFRLLSRRAVDNLLQMGESHRYLRGMVQWLGFRVSEVPYRPEARGAGVSKYTLRKMLRLGLDGLCSFSRAPLRLGVTAGLLATGVSLVAAFGWALNAGAGGWFLAMLLAGHCVLGSLFAALGALGEYVGRVYEESKRRPLFVIKDEIPAAIPQRRAA